MSQHDLERALRDHYQDQSLQPELRSKLMQQYHDRFQHQPRRTSLWYGLSAALLLFGLGIAWMTFAPATPPAKGQIVHATTDRTQISPQEIAETVAAHHLLGKPSTYFGSDTASIARQMPRLDFTPTPSQRLIGYELNGARYCSIAGTIAMQVSLSKDQQRQTLYISRQPSQAPVLTEPVTTHIAGTTVINWSENNLFFALAE